MTVPYYVRLFRDAKSADERAAIYRRCPKGMKSRIIRRFKICTKCFNALRWAGQKKCQACFTRDFRVYSRTIYMNRKWKMEGLPVHPRICIGCHKVFPSIKGSNLCNVCFEAGKKLLAQKTLMKDESKLGMKSIAPFLTMHYGRKWNPTLRPRIKMSDIGVLDSVRRSA